MRSKEIKIKEIITVIIGIIIAGAALALAAGGGASATATVTATATTTSCPPDVAVKWYALMNYAALAAGQNVSKLIAEASSSGYVVVNISGVELKIPYCSLNATTANGAKVAFVPAVGAGELKKLGLNITQARQVFEQLKEARRVAMANLTRYLKPLERAGFKEAAGAFANDSGYLKAAEANKNASAALRALAFVVEKAAHNKTLAAELRQWAEVHNQTASLLMYVKAHGGLRDIQSHMAASLAAALNGSAGTSRAEAEVNESLGRLEAVLQLLKSVNASQAAINAVQSAVERHKIALEVLGNLSHAGGLSGVVRDLEDAIKAGGQIRPAVRALCHINVSQILREMAQRGFLNAAAVEVPAAKFEAICQLVQIFAPSGYLNKTKPIILPTSAKEEIKNYINKHGLSHILQNPGLLAELNEMLHRVIGGMGGSTTTTTSSGMGGGK